MNVKALIAEFLGTFALLYAGVGSIAANQLGAGIGPLGVALVFGLAIAVMVGAFGHISGAHFNPAVSLGLFVGKQISLPTMITYWIVQVLGAAAGVWMLTQTMDINALKYVHMGIPALGDTTSQTSAVLIEGIATFFLVLVIFGTAVDKRGQKASAGLFIGLTITLGMLFAGQSTGAALNPARYLGSAFFYQPPEGQPQAMADMPIYLVGTLLGGLLAGLVYGHFLIKDDASPAAVPADA
ncbi:MAG: aquaporin [Fimbriimonadaceae bacterium]|nr:aquaporin [Chthonomonadaceae bacterium]MCO5295988.1 aquaporin [Fimbriimonadaceae bacterium]